jgi:hypothetical protein
MRYSKAGIEHSEYAGGCSCRYAVSFAILFTEYSVDRRRPGLAAIGGTSESRGRIEWNIKHAARAMVFSLIDHDEVARGQSGILHDGAGRGVVAIKFGEVSRIALPERHRPTHHLLGVSNAVAKSKFFRSVVWRTTAPNWLPDILLAPKIRYGPAGVAGA